MREILEKKSLEEIRFLEQKVMDIKHNTDEEFMAIFDEEDKLKTGKVLIVEKHPGAAAIWEQQMSQKNIDQNALIQTGFISSKKHSLPLGSPTDSEYLRTMQRVLEDPVKTIKEDAEEGSMKETSFNTSKVNTTSNQNVTLKATNLLNAKKSVSTDKEMYTDRTTLMNNLGFKKVSLGESVNMTNADLLDERKSTVQQPGKIFILNISVFKLTIRHSITL